MEIFVSLFSAFSVLSTVWLAEIAVFSKFLRKKSVFRISEKRCFRKMKFRPGIETKDLQGVKSVRK